MALSLKIIGPANTGVVNAFTFYPGEERIFRAQVFDLDNGAPFAIPDGSTKTLFLPGTPTDLEISDGSITIDASDKSIFSCNLTEVQTAQMTSGDVRFQFISSGVTRIAYREMGASRLNMVV